MLKQCLMLVSLLSVALNTSAAETPSNMMTKSYTLTKLERVVTNAPQCKPYFEALQQLEKKPIELKFSKNAKNEMQIEDVSGQTSHHSHKMLKQTVNGNKVHRMAMGTFEFNHETIDYLVSISGNAENPDHQYLYPIILESHDAQCYYTALVKPSDATVDSFKKSIQSGDAAKKHDLVR